MDSNLCISNKVPRDIITIHICDYLSIELVEKIALMQWNSKETHLINSIKRLMYDGKTSSDCFHVVAMNDWGEVVGRLYCLQNQYHPYLWYGGDLKVSAEYRRLHIASSMLLSAINVLQDRGCQVLRTYVEADNKPSLNLFEKFAFEEKPFEVFDNLYNEGQRMFEKVLQPYNAVLATVDDAPFITMIYGKNMELLHGEIIMFDTWKKLLTNKESDDEYFLIQIGAMPCAILKITGLHNHDNAWISMLAVEPSMHKQGCGSYAIKYAENYVGTIGIKKLRIRINADNNTAHKFFIKHGYTVIDQNGPTTGDDAMGKRYTLEKRLD